MAKFLFNPETKNLYYSNVNLEEQNVKQSMGLLPVEADDPRAVDFFERMEKIKAGDVVVEVTLAPAVQVAEAMPEADKK